MSINILFELQHELRRLYIAGSGMAAGDLRLGKMLPQLQKLGESAPVFNKFAQGVNELLASDRAEAASKLLELGTLLHSVLYTQGKTEGAGEIYPLVGTEIKADTSIPYRKIAPLIEALTQKGQGRLEQIHQAFNEGLFHDFRVISAAVTALDDSYAEIPEFLFHKVISQYGADALPMLKQQFQLQGGKGHARRLQLIHNVEGEAAIDLYLQAATEGSVDVRAAAIELLGEYPEQEQFLLEQADDKKKELRRAALSALSKLGSDKAQDCLFQALTSKDHELAVEPIRLCGSDELIHRVIRQTEDVLAEIVAGKENDEQEQHLISYLSSIEGDSSNELCLLLQKILSVPASKTAKLDRLQEVAAQMLLDLDDPEAYAFTVGLQQKYNRRFIAYSFRAAVHSLPPEEVYERYATELSNKRTSAAKELLRTMSMISVDITDQMNGNSAIETWDPRWVHLLIKLDEKELVTRFAIHSDSTVISYLTKQITAHPKFQDYVTVDMLLALFHLRDDNVSEMVMDILERDKTSHSYYLNRSQTALLSQLSPVYADRLRQFAETMKYQNVKQQVLDIADTVAAKPS
ncbi:HEAT repeat domain-containing protein [Paenibacillus sp. IHBB 10380]|uniref:HEAT repeat domain-containing protein n=1 Tax=Paenibacillus sp. IHBB 10380 TaxID=1566358 RepID=UPI0005CFB221|nr:HEAT repeat domain-containing protein [Paenibacillus sp. IHBB 10380]